MSIIKEPRVNASGYLELGALAVGKTVVERLAQPYIGNGTLMSGACKVIGGGVLYSIGGSGALGMVTKGLGGGAVVDGFEDLTQALLGPVIDKATATPAAQGMPAVSGRAYGF